MAQVPKTHLVCHPSQLPPEVRQLLETIKQQPTDPPAVLVGRNWNDEVSALGFAGHIVDLAVQPDGDVRILTHDHTGHVAIFEVSQGGRTRIRLLAKPQRAFVHLGYSSQEKAQAAWRKLNQVRFHWYDAVHADDAARARELDPLTDWAMAGYPIGPLPESVRLEKEARKAKAARASKIRLGCCLGLFVLLGLAGAALLGRQLLIGRDRDRAYAQNAARFRQEQAARAYAEAHPPTTTLAVEPTLARITPQLASPAAVAFMRVLLKDLSERPDADRFVQVQLEYDRASNDAVDAELRRRHSPPLGNQRMWLGLTIPAERLTADVFGRLGLPGLRFETARFGQAATAPRPTVTIRVAERVSSTQRYRISRGTMTYYGIDLLLDVTAAVPGRPERLTLHHETLATPSRSANVDLGGPRTVYEADRQRAGEEVVPRIAALFVR